MKVITIKNWRRPYMYNLILTALNGCDGIGEYKIINCIDYFNDETSEQIARLDRTHKLSKKIEIETVVYESPQGCAQNTYNCLEKGFGTGADFVIHLEDDTVPSRDYLKFMEAAYEVYRRDPEIFVVVGWNRRTDNLTSDQIKTEMEIIGKRTPTRTFQAWGIRRAIWDEVRGNWFGIHWKEGFSPGEMGDNVPSGDAFLDVIRRSNDGSWGWPMLKYHCKTRRELFPLVSRCQNIGDTDGRFNFSQEWHRNYIHTTVFADQISWFSGYKVMEFS